MSLLKLFVAALALGLSTCASAQDSGARDASFVRGRAAYLPASTLSLLTKVEDFCKSADQSARDAMVAAVDGWRLRHAELLQENSRVLNELKAEVNAPEAGPGLKAALDNMLDQRVPQQVETDYKKMVPPDASQGWASKAFVCGANAGMIKDGKYDLERFDPAVADYLRKQIAQRKSGDPAGP